jgi:hypothetical protein
MCAPLAFETLHARDTRIYVLSRTLIAFTDSKADVVWWHETTGANGKVERDLKKKS